MNTPAHLIFGIVAFGKPERAVVTLAAAVGALIPDVSLYGLAGWELLVKGTDPSIVFGELYYSEAWQSVFRIDNSFVLWGIGIVAAVLMRSQILFAMTAAALLHLLLDFPLHNDDARAHFWPISNWKFYSPISYWDGRYYGHIVGPVEVALVIATCAVGWRKFKGWAIRGFLLALTLAEAAPIIVFGLMFGSPT